MYQGLINTVLCFFLAFVVSSPLFFFAWLYERKETIKNSKFDYAENKFKK